MSSLLLRVHGLGQELLVVVLMAVEFALPSQNIVGWLAHPVTRKQASTYIVFGCLSLGVGLWPCIHIPKHLPHMVSSREGSRWISGSPMHANSRRSPPSKAWSSSNVIILPNEPTKYLQIHHASVRAMLAMNLDISRLPGLLVKAFVLYILPRRRARTVLVSTHPSSLVQRACFLSRC